jgi:hypothetical protein
MRSREVLIQKFGHLSSKGEVTERITQRATPHGLKRM